MLLTQRGPRASSCRCRRGSTSCSSPARHLVDCAAFKLKRSASHSSRAERWLMRRLWRMESGTWMRPNYPITALMHVSHVSHGQ